MSVEFKVWWVPQLPMKAFEVSVPTRDEGRRLCDTLGRYDAFQFENQIKPDYCNTGGVVFRLDGLTEGEFWDADDDDDWADYVRDFPILSAPQSPIERFEDGAREGGGEMSEHDKLIAALASDIDAAQLKWKSENGGDDASILDMPTDLIAKTATQSIAERTKEATEAMCEGTNSHAPDAIWSRMHAASALWPLGRKQPRQCKRV